MHARKMITAEMGLAAAFPYRCAPLDGVGGMLMLVVLVIGLGAVAGHRRRLGRETTSGH